MSDEFLKERKQSLEEEFFHKENAKKIKAMREKLKVENTREGLRKASGLTSDALLDRLVELGMSADTVAALNLIPLIHVAWADGVMQNEEREAILNGAKDRGIDSDSPAYEILDTWLANEPESTLFEAWSGYVKAFAKEHLNDEQFEELRQQILGFAQSVAEAAGGFLGINAVAKSERDAIDAIKAAMQSD
jgi:hypothetical protein